MLSSYLSVKFQALQRNVNFERETYCVYNFCLSLQLLTKKVTIYSKLSFQLTPPSIYFVAQYYNFKRPFSVLFLSSASWRTLVQKACFTLYIYDVVSENHKKMVLEVFLKRLSIIILGPTWFQNPNPGQCLHPYQLDNLANHYTIFHCCLDFGMMTKTEIQISFSWATN